MVCIDKIIKRVKVFGRVLSFNFSVHLTVLLNNKYQITRELQSYSAILISKIHTFT